MRLALRLVVPAIVIVLVAGCGSSQVAFEEAPGAPADLTVPGDASALAPASATTTPTPAPTEDAEEQSTTEVPAEPTAEAPLQTAPEGTEGGGTEAPGDDGAPPDSEASEEFCAVNPGAC